MGTIFISYRRGDTEGQARALFNELARKLGKDSVFMDVDSIAIGRDFRQVLQEHLETCELMLALVGPGWADAKDKSGKRRLDSLGDFVRIEIASALKRNIPVTPVLLQGAQMPSEEQLPEDLRDFAYRNAFELSHNRWESDVQEMIRRLGLAKQSDSEAVSNAELRVQNAPSQNTSTNALTAPSRLFYSSWLSNKRWITAGLGAILILIVGGYQIYYPKDPPVQKDPPLQKDSPVQKDLPVDLSGNYTYSGEGVAQVEQKENVRILLTWKGESKPGPHFEVNATLDGKTLKGQWYSHIMKEGWYDFVGEVDPAGNIHFTKSDDPIRSGMKTVVLRRQKS